MRWRTVNTAAWLEHTVCGWGPGGYTWSIRSGCYVWSGLFSHRGEKSDAQRGQGPYPPADQWAENPELQPSSTTPTGLSCPFSYLRHQDTAMRTRPCPGQQLLLTTTGKEHEPRHHACSVFNHSDTPKSRYKIRRRAVGARVLLIG